MRNCIRAFFLYLFLFLIGQIVDLCVFSFAIITLRTKANVYVHVFEKLQTDEDTLIKNAWIC